ncbi:MAG: triose-phosphate isomerase [Pirellulales bacterium]|nr:triose-phosphate isomerase [Pirellulales bacterium]
MRRQLIAGNWKMNTNRASAAALAEGVAKAAASITDADLAVSPPSCYLETVGKALRGSRVALGAQNMYFEKDGAFTGELSAAMLVDLGCKYVILGHSERRHIFGEDDPLINKKVLAALAAGLAPIVCLGELLADREAGRTEQVVRTQFDGSLAGLTPEQICRVVIAYEPVWAIGTGRTATPQQAEEVHLILRRLLVDKYNGEAANRVIIQYGGSVKPDNAVELLGQPNIDGALVGGASLKVEPFLGIVAGRKR